MSRLTPEQRRLVCVQARSLAHQRAVERESARYLPPREQKRDERVRLYARGKVDGIDAAMGAVWPDAVNALSNRAANIARRFGNRP